MKITKLLTCFTSLALVLGLGACAEAEDEDESSISNESELDSESSGDSSSNSSSTSTSDSNDSSKGFDKILDFLKEECNYSTFIEYEIYQSELFDSSSSSTNVSTSLAANFILECFYTEDAVLSCVYYNENYYYAGYVMYTEMHVNIPNGGGLYHYTLSENAQYSNELTLTETITEITSGGTYYAISCWQDYLFYMGDFLPYAGTGYAVYSESSSNYGPVIQYSLTTEAAYVLLLSLFGSNYIEDYYEFAYYMYYYYLISYYSCVYYYDYDELDVYFGSPDVTWTYDESQSYIEQDNLYGAIYDVGTTEIPSAYSSFLA